MHIISLNGLRQGSQTQIDSRAAWDSKDFEGCIEKVKEMGKMLQPAGNVLEIPGLRRPIEVQKK